MAEKSKILIVEDEESIRVGLCDLFVYHGYSVDWTDDGKSGLEKALQGNYDILVLDVMLPNIDGFTLCQKIKEAKREQAIIMLTAKSSEEDIINGLSLGADDYISKPFSVRELVLRVEALLRRVRAQGPKIKKLVIGEKLEINIDLLQGITPSTSTTTDFTLREIEILNFLKANEQRFVSREELLAEVWGYEKAASIETRTVDIHIAKLRRKIESDPKNPEFIVTNRGQGYRLVNSKTINE